MSNAAGTKGLAATGKIASDLHSSKETHDPTERFYHTVMVSQEELPASGRRCSRDRADMGRVRCKRAARRIEAGGMGTPQS